MKNITKFEKAYKEIIEVLNKYKDICVYDISDMESKAKKHLFGIELKEKYGFNVEPKDIYSCDVFLCDNLNNWLRQSEPPRFYRY